MKQALHIEQKNRRRQKPPSENYPRDRFLPEKHLAWRYLVDNYLSKPFSRFGAFKASLRKIKSRVFIQKHKEAILVFAHAIDILPSEICFAVFRFLIYAAIVKRKMQNI
jgi:hypothetical protein